MLSPKPPGTPKVGAVPEPVTHDEVYGSEEIGALATNGESLPDNQQNLRPAELDPFRPLAAPMDPQLQSSPSRPLWLLADIPASVAVGADVSLLVRVGETPSGVSKSGPLKAFAINPGGVKVTLIVQAPHGLLPIESLEQTLLVPETGDSEPVRFAFRAGVAGLFEIRVAAFAGGTFLGELVAQLSVGWVSLPTDAPTRVAQKRRASRARRGDVAGPV